MPDADDFDLEELRRLLRGEPPPAKPATDAGEGKPARAGAPRGRGKTGGTAKGKKAPPGRRARR